MKQGWEYKRFDEVFNLQMGKTPDRKNLDYFGGKNVWISIRDLGDKEVSESNEHITDKAVSDTNIRKVKKGTVIMSFKLTVGKCGIAAKDLYTNEAIMAFNTKEGYDINSSFLYYYLQCYNWKGSNKAVMGITLNKATISKHHINIPPKSTQLTIVSELDKINELIRLKKEQLKDYDNLAQSIFYEMFGDPVENEKGWEVKKLEENVEEMFLGPFGSALKVDSYVSKEESYCMVYEQKHAIKKTIDLENHYISKEKFDGLKRFSVKPGDFIMSCRGTIGKLFEIPNDAPLGIIHPSLMKIRLKKDGYNPTFFQFMLVKIVANESTNGNCVQMAITAKALGKKKLPLPPLLPLQHLFAQRIEQIEHQKSEVTKAITDLETLLASRMQHWFE